MQHTCSSNGHLQPGKELICILVLPEVQALAVIVFESIPERTGDIVILVSQCQIRKHILHDQQCQMSAQSFLQQVQVQVQRYLQTNSAVVHIHFGKCTRWTSKTLMPVSSTLFECRSGVQSKLTATDIQEGDPCIGKTQDSYACLHLKEDTLCLIIRGLRH